MRRRTRGDGGRSSLAVRAALLILLLASALRGQYNPAAGATSCSAPGANWLTCTISGGKLALGAAAGQTSHQVIGTCGSATSFGPCQPACSDLSNAANSCSTDATNAANISAGTLGTGRLPNSTGYAALSGNGGGATVSSGATVYFGLGTGSDGVTETLKAIPMPFACTLRNFQVITTSTQSAGGTLVLTVRTQLSFPSSGPMVTVADGAAAGGYSDTTDTATISAGQVIDIQVVNNGSGASAGVGGWSIGCVPN